MKKTFKQFLIEAPLPDEWDKDTFKSNVSFAKRIRYAKEKAQKIGSGSSRVAFVIPYDGRKTVLKVAKNAKGVAQNEEEVVLFGDWYLNNLNIVIPMIDYDEENGDHPTWIHTEYADKVQNSHFVKLSGVTLPTLIAYAENVSGRKKISHINFDKVDEESELVQSIVDFVGNYTHVPTGDLSRLANWGLYHGRPVIIDLGLTDSTLKYYT